MVGYQGLSARSSIQRQSAWLSSIVHTAAPSAPARCAIMVSTVRTRSSWRISSTVVNMFAFPVAGCAISVPSGEPVRSGCLRQRVGEEILLDRHASVFHAQTDVDMTKSTQPMRDHEDGATAAQALQALNDRRLGLRV